MTSLNGRRVKFLMGVMRSTMTFGELAARNDLCGAITSYLARQISVVRVEHLACSVTHFQAGELVSFLLETRNNRTNESALNTVRFDHDVSPLLLAGVIITTTTERERAAARYCHRSESIGAKRQE